MGLIRCTVLTKDGDDAYAGTVLFNTKFISNLHEGDTGSLFRLHKGSRDTIGSLYNVSDSILTIDNAFAYSNVVFFSIAKRDDVNDSTSDTTTRIFDPNDIIFGISLPSDTSQSLLWIEEKPGKVEKVLVDSFLKSFSDKSSTGTTTTYE